MSDTSALAAAPAATVEETTVDTVQPTQETAETAGGSEAGASGAEIRRLEPGNQKERKAAVARIRNSNLPPVMRERLAAVMEASESSHLDVAVCLEAIEETLPEFLHGGRGNFVPSVHPLGNAFFHGTEELTDAEAETLATKQLERSGLLRGQRVRVADYSVFESQILRLIDGLTLEEIGTDKTDISGEIEKLTGEIAKRDNYLAELKPLLENLDVPPKDVVERMVRVENEKKSLYKSLEAHKN